MSDLTKEYFDRRMTGIDKRFDAVDKRFESLESTLETEISGLATMITKGFADLEKRLDVRDRVEHLRRK